MSDRLDWQSLGKGPDRAGEGWRAPVPGGWLYLVSRLGHQSMVFVPHATPTQELDDAHGQGALQVIQAQSGCQSGCKGDVLDCPCFTTARELLQQLRGHA
ncbi:hypothetical protein [Roseomonas sp. BN140053]|uniref:hypothetical protein n=1 Tax=Roseomonas sp. BN140053 TaxID=3391898 RepID=UPI0039E9BB4A